MAFQKQVWAKRKKSTSMNLWEVHSCVCELQCFVYVCISVRIYRCANVEASFVQLCNSAFVSLYVHVNEHIKGGQMREYNHMECCNSCYELDEQQHVKIDKDHLKRYKIGQNWSIGHLKRHIIVLRMNWLISSKHTLPDIYMMKVCMFGQHHMVSAHE